MVTAVAITAGPILFPHRSVPHLSSTQIHNLVEEVHRHGGPDLVFDNRANRSEIFERKGDHEVAEMLKREAGYILDVFV